LTLNTFTRTGYSFSGWNTAANGSGTSYADGASYPFTADATLYAQWTATCYALTLGYTGHGTTPSASPTHSTGCSAGLYVYGENITLSGATPDTGWGIASWSGTSNNSSKASTNSLSMPASAHSAGVNYLRLLGDVNSDGSVNSTDALIVLSADAGLNTLTYCPMNYGDVNGDGYVNSTDALIILSYDVGMTIPFLVGQPVAEPALTTQPPGCGH